MNEEIDFEEGIVETTDEIPYMGTNNIQATENIKTEHEATDDYNNMKPDLFLNKKLCKEEFGESNVEGNKPTDCSNV